MMEETIQIAMSKAEVDELQLLLADYLTNSKAANQRMDETEVEIAKLKLETRAMLRDLTTRLNVETAF